MLLLLALLSTAAPPTEADCTRAGWRAASSASALLDPSLGETGRRALATVRDEARRVLDRCPDAPPVTPACGSQGAEAAIEAALARARLLAAAAPLDTLPSLPTQHARVRDALAAESRAQMAARTPPDAVEDLTLAQELSALSTATRALEAQIDPRVQAEARLREAEQAWVAASRTWNAARCEAGCAPGPCADEKAGHQRQLGTLRRLYTDLHAADAAFVRTWGVDSLATRLREAGLEDPGGAHLRARAALLTATLADLAPRPASARARLAALLAEIDGQPRLTSAQRQRVVAWTLYDRDWRAALARIPGDLDRIADVWLAMEQAQGTAQRQTLAERWTRAMERLKRRDAAAPR